MFKQCGDWRAVERNHMLVRRRLLVQSRREKDYNAKLTYTATALEKEKHAPVAKQNCKQQHTLQLPENVLRKQRLNATRGHEWENQHFSLNLFWGGQMDVSGSSEPWWRGAPQYAPGAAYHSPSCPEVPATQLRMVQAERGGLRDNMQMVLVFPLDLFWCCCHVLRLWVNAVRRWAAWSPPHFSIEGLSHFFFLSLNNYQHMPVSGVTWIDKKKITPEGFTGDQKRNIAISRGSFI